MSLYSIDEGKILIKKDSNCAEHLFIKHSGSFHVNYSSNKNSFSSFDTFSSIVFGERELLNNSTSRFFTVKSITNSFVYLLNKENLHKELCEINATLINESLFSNSLLYTVLSLEMKNEIIKYYDEMTYLEYNENDVVLNSGEKHHGLLFVVQGVVVSEFKKIDNEENLNCLVSSNSLNLIDEQFDIGHICGFNNLLNENFTNNKHIAKNTVTILVNIPYKTYNKIMNINNAKIKNNSKLSIYNTGKFNNNLHINNRFSIFKDFNSNSNSQDLQKINPSNTNNISNYSSDSNIPSSNNSDLSCSTILLLGVVLYNIGYISKSVIENYYEENFFACGSSSNTGNLNNILGKNNSGNIVNKNNNGSSLINKNIINPNIR